MKVLFKNAVVGLEHLIMKRNFFDSEFLHSDRIIQCNFKTNLFPIIAGGIKFR